MKGPIGITSTIPIEILYAAALIPIDLNNYFIASKTPREMVNAAEKKGFPRNCCSWIKGIFSSCMELNIEVVVGVLSGDCNQTQVLCQVLEEKGIRILPFCYPNDHNPDYLKIQMDALRCQTGTTWEQIEETRQYLDGIRRKVKLIDNATWERNLVSGRENHLYLITCSDMQGDPGGFERQIEGFLSEIDNRNPYQESVRLGYIGVPPIMTDLYDFCESVGGRIVFNEIQRQFSMPNESNSLVDQYSDYTYPYPLKSRLKDIMTEIKKRGLDGLIHYTQSFCFRNMEDLIFKRHIKIPILTIEADQPGNMDTRTKIRVETFIEMLREKT